MLFRKKTLLLPLLFCTILLLGSCASSNPNSSKKRVADRGMDKALVDSILKIGLDHEALYTLVSDIKPMSSLMGFTLPFNIDSTDLIQGHPIDLKKKSSMVAKLKRYTTVLNRLQIEDLDFVMVPFRASTDSTRSFQVNVIRKSRMDEVINNHLDFFAYLGIVPGTEPNVVLSTVESQDQILRLRAYGYLFGYPDHAVDFFVAAYYENEQTGEFVERDFFQIPVFTRKSGHFVYAIPKGQTPSQVDSTLYKRAIRVLDVYKAERPDFLNADSTLQTLKLIRKMSR